MTVYRFSFCLSHSQTFIRLQCQQYASKTHSSQMKTHTHTHTQANAHNKAPSHPFISNQSFPGSIASPSAPLPHQPRAIKVFNEIAGSFCFKWGLWSLKINVVLFSLSLCVFFPSSPFSLFYFLKMISVNRLAGHSHHVGFSGAGATHNHEFLLAADAPA